MIIIACHYCGKSVQVHAYKLRQGKGKYCNGFCYGRAKTQQAAERAAQQFALLVDRSAGPHGCWPWMGKRDKQGYGILYERPDSRTPRGRRLILTHQYAYEQLHGPIPQGMLVLHHCDNPPCCNAERCLFLGTYADNAHDAMHKGRFVGGESHGRHTSPDSFAHFYGETHPGAKLTEIHVREILQHKQTMSMVACAALYNVNPSTISHIWHGKSWKHLSLTPSAAALRGEDSAATSAGSPARTRAGVRTSPSPSSGHFA